MNDRLRQKALDMHNYRRSNLAQGSVRKNNMNLLPSATNMIRLRYDCSLESSARLSVERCTETPYTSLSSDVQENIYGVQKSMAMYRINATVLVS
ncbi:hypothetical protein COOONC_05595 [Cooperia oncophora]